MIPRRQRRGGSTALAWAAIAALLACFSFVPPATAGDGRIPISFGSPPTFPLTISNPGSYYLTQDVAASYAGNIISVSSDDVP